MSASITVAGLVYFELRAPARHVPMGQEEFVARIDAAIGGAFTTAWVAHLLGAAVRLAHPAGAGLTDRAVAELVARLGLPSLTWPGRDDPAISLVFTAAEERAFISAAEFSALERCPDLADSAWIHVPGLVEARVLEPRLRAARARGARVSVAGSWATDELDALAGARPPWDYLFLNELEAERAAGLTEEAPERLASAVPNVIVTRGARGSLGCVGGQRFTVPAARQLTVCDATGAGDAFVAGFLAAHVRGADARRSAEVGSEVAARYLDADGRKRLDPTLFVGVLSGASDEGPAGRAQEVSS